jgi:hypothetical protein
LVLSAERSVDARERFNNTQNSFKTPHFDFHIKCISRIKIAQLNILKGRTYIVVD